MCLCDLYFTEEKEEDADEEGTDTEKVLQSRFSRLRAGVVSI